eukprot:3480357-Rhodomonas_salina.1
MGTSLLPVAPVVLVGIPQATAVFGQVGPVTRAGICCRIPTTSTRILGIPSSAGAARRTPTIIAASHGPLSPSLRDVQVRASSGGFQGESWSCKSGPVVPGGKKTGQTGAIMIVALPQFACPGNASSGLTPGCDLGSGTIRLRAGRQAGMTATGKFTDSGADRNQRKNTRNVVTSQQGRH